VEERQAVVRTREALQSHAESTDDLSASGYDRMKVLAAQTRMLQIAKAQAEELTLLRRELERLRQNAFPSFPSNHPQFFATQ
jgi:hypothetical protein